MKYCPKCRVENKKDAKFCKGCRHPFVAKNVASIKIADEIYSSNAKTDTVEPSQTVKVRPVRNDFSEIDTKKYSRPRNKFKVIVVSVILLLVGVSTGTAYYYFSTWNENISAALPVPQNVEPQTPVTNSPTAIGPSPQEPAVSVPTNPTPVISQQTVKPVTSRQSGSAEANRQKLLELKRQLGQ